MHIFYFYKSLNNQTLVFWLCRRVGIFLSTLFFIWQNTSFWMCMLLEKLCRQIILFIRPLVLQKKTLLLDKHFSTKSHSSGLKQKLNINWDKLLNIWLEMLLAEFSVQQRNNFLGIAFHISKHFQKCKCYV